MSRVEKIKAHLQKRRERASLIAQKAVEAERMRLLEQDEKDRQLPQKIHGYVVTAQLVFTTLGGTFIGYFASHIGEDIFINAMMAGMADGLANATSGIVLEKFGLLIAYRAFLLTAIIFVFTLQFFQITGQVSFIILFIAVYCTGCSMNWATATAMSQTPIEKRKPFMMRAVTIATTSQGFIPVLFLTRPQPAASWGMCFFLFISWGCIHFLIDK